MCEIGNEFLIRQSLIWEQRRMQQVFSFSLVMIQRATMPINAVIIIIKSIFYAWWGEEYACICINYWCNLANLSLSIHDSVTMEKVQQHITLECAPWMIFISSAIIMCECVWRRTWKKFQGNWFCINLIEKTADDGI